MNVTVALPWAPAGVAVDTGLEGVASSTAVGVATTVVEVAEVWAVGVAPTIVCGGAGENVRAGVGVRVGSPGPPLSFPPPPPPPQPAPTPSAITTAIDTIPLTTCACMAPLHTLLTVQGKHGRGDPTVSLATVCVAVTRRRCAPRVSTLSLRLDGSSMLRIAFAIVVAATLTCAPVRAQIIPICGDANNDGDIEESDGIAALRAAAELPTTCPIAVCDVNADGRISVTDAVNILRNALVLPSVDACKDVTGGTG
ncbi:MAG: hypothetical protein E6J72_07675 [Deltaproteobacteria bacterium]|nr:MAG: hypothetical protein E6J72_07675 [Deltaproteobacteria bacterium]